MTAGDAFGKFFPFARKPGPGKKAIRVKKGKELAVSAAAAAAGGAGAGSKLANDAAKKKVEGAAKKKPADNAKKKAADKAKGAYEEKRKRAMMEETGKNAAKKGPRGGMEEQRKKKVAGVVTDKSDDKDKKENVIFDRLMKDNATQEEIEKQELLKPFVGAGKITENQMKAVMECGAQSEHLSEYIKTDSVYSKDKILQHLPGQIGTIKAEEFFSKHGFETETEVRPASKDGKKLDVVARADLDITFQYQSVDDASNIITKQDTISSGKIIWVESKSYKAEYYGTEKSMETLLGQVSNSVNSGNIERTYAYFASDFKELPAEERARIAERIRGSKGEIIISDNSTERNNTEAKKILKKLRAGEI